MLRQQTFEKYFNLEEAAQLIPFVKRTFDEANTELLRLKDDIILYKRMQQVQENAESRLTEAPSAQMLSDMLHQKWHTYEDCFFHWVNVLADRGIQVRDFRKGLIDFPYQAKDGREYFLCWQFGEDGLFYFHEIETGYSGRQPISLLPD